MKVSREERLARIRRNEGIGQQRNRRERLREQVLYRPEPVPPSYSSESNLKVYKMTIPNGTTMATRSVPYEDEGSTTIRETRSESRTNRLNRIASNTLSPLKRKPNRPRPESPISREHVRRSSNRADQGNHEFLETIDVSNTSNLDRYQSRGRSPLSRRGAGSAYRIGTYSSSDESYSRSVSASRSPVRSTKITSYVGGGKENPRTSRSPSRLDSTHRSYPNQMDKRDPLTPQSTMAEVRNSYRASSPQRLQPTFRDFGSSEPKKQNRSKYTTPIISYQAPDESDTSVSRLPPPPPPSPKIASLSSSQIRGVSFHLEEEKEHRFSSDRENEATDLANELEMVQEEPGSAEQRFKPLSAIGRLRASQLYPKEIHQVETASTTSSITITPDRHLVNGKKLQRSLQVNGRKILHGSEDDGDDNDDDDDDDGYLSSHATMGRPNPNSRPSQGDLRTPPSQYSIPNSGFLTENTGQNSNDSFDKILNPTPPDSSGNRYSNDSIDSLLSFDTGRRPQNERPKAVTDKTGHSSQDIRSKSLFNSSAFDSESRVSADEPGQNGSKNGSKRGSMRSRDSKSNNSSDLDVLTTRGFNVTVVKKSRDDKIGINVGKKKTKYGYRLVVTRISPTGLFVDSPIEVGDIVQSINGKNFLDRPSSSAALDVVRNAKEKITFVVRRPEDDNFTADLQLPSLPHAEPNNQTVTTTETWNDDGSVMVSKEEFDDAGSVRNKRIHKRMINPDGSITVSTDEHSLDGTAPRMLVNESINISGTMRITVTKQSKDERLGLQLLTREGSGGRVLFISKIDPNGLFGRTPLRVGDVVLSVNSFSFQDNADAGLASSVIRSADKDITIVARKSESSLHDFLLNQGNRMYSSETNSRASESAHFRPPSNSAEDAYDTPIEGKNKTMEVTFRKKHPSDRVGISMATRNTKLGNFLVVTSISPNGAAANTELKAGDVILSVNGVDFEEDPDTEHAARVIRLASDVVDIKFQRISGWRPAAAENSRPKKTQITQTILPGGERVVKTETLKEDGTTTVKIEEFIPPQGIHLPLPLGRTESDISGLHSLDMSEASVAASYDESMLRMRGDRVGVERGKSGVAWGTAIGGSPARSRADSDPNRPAHRILPEVDSKSFKPTTIVAFKTDPDQEVGLVLDNVKGSLVVAKISPTGMFAGKPILPGDRVVSVNSISFRDDPDVSMAQALIDNAYQEVRVEILKSEKGADKDRKFWKPKSFLGLKRSKLKKIVDRSKSWSGKVASFRRSRVNKSGDEEPVESTPDTSLEKDNEVHHL